MVHDHGRRGGRGGYLNTTVRARTATRQLHSGGAVRGSTPRAGAGRWRYRPGRPQGGAVRRVRWRPYEFMNGARGYGNFSSFCAFLHGMIEEVIILDGKAGLSYTELVRTVVTTVLYRYSTRNSGTAVLQVPVQSYRTVPVRTHIIPWRRTRQAAS